MNTDVAPELLGGGDYPDAKNIHSITESTESTGKHIPVRGNLFSFQLGAVPVQNKTWRLFISTQAAPHTGHLWFLTQDGELINNTTIPLHLAAPPFYEWDMSLGFAAQVAAITAIITAGIPVIDPTATIVGTDTSGADTAGYVDITFNGIAGYDLGFFATHDPSASAMITDARLDSEIIQEAYDISLAGDLNCISSNDLLGDLYIWSTPQKNLPTTLSETITTVTSVAGKYRITMTGAHGLTTGMKVVIRNVDVAALGATAINPNSTWIITVVSPTVFDVQEFFTVTTGFVQGALGGNVTIYTEGVGEIGAAVKDINTSAWVYTRLLRTKEWNFRTKKQIDSRPSVRTEQKDSFYFTDYFSVPRNFYYTKPFVTDGALSINGGRYDYGSISEETRNIISSSAATIDFVSQTQGGGAVRSGNWRYSGRFISETLAPSDPLVLTNPINVFTEDTGGDPTAIKGDAAGVTTPKINNLRVSGIIAGLFKYFDLIGINYVGNAIEGFVIKRILLDGVSDALDISHTGTETDVTDLDLGTLNSFSAPIVAAKSNEIIDNRLVYSNIREAEQDDLAAWAQTIKHSLYYKLLPTVRSEITPAFTFPNNLQVAEYQLPENVNDFAGYMLNETYRIGIRGRYKNTGQWSGAHHVDDITFDTLAYARRNNTLLRLDLLDIYGSPFTNNNIQVPYLALEDIDLDFLIDGVKIRDLFDKLEVVRAECVPEVLACGVALLGISGWNNVGSFVDTDPVIGTSPPNTNLVAEAYMGGRDHITTFVAGFQDTFVNNELASFYSPDIILNNTSITFSAGDRMLNWGEPAFSIEATIIPPSGVAAHYDKTGTRTGVTSAGGGNPFQDIVLDDMEICTMGNSISIGGVSFAKRKYIDNSPSANGTIDSIASPVIYYSGGFTNPSLAAVTRSGMRYMQYFRALTDKYGDPSTTKYITCGAIVDIDSTTLSPISIDVFGGDTFTQNMYLRERMSDSVLNGYGHAISFYCQNRVNSQMGESANSRGADLGIWLSNTAPNQDSTDYNTGYNIRNQVQSFIAFDPNADNVSDKPTWIQWSELNNLGSTKDNFRVFLPLNFHVLDQSFGEIVHHANGNGELITWQDRKFQRQYFNTRGQLDSSGLGIVIGDGSVMSRDGVTLSLFGCQHKWSVIKGRSNGGNDVFYWINQELKKAVRFGYDGTVSIGDIKGLQSFFANNLTWVEGKDTPADEDGIHGIWDERFKEMIWTVVGRNTSISDWDSAVTYAAGQLAYFSSDPFNRTGDTYESLVGFNLNNQPDTSPLFWVKLTVSGEYFNNYSLAYNEFKNGFSCFTTPVPRIYLQWRDSYLTPRPTGDVSELYEHHQGDLLRWYDNGFIIQEEEGFIEGVINKGYPETKWFEAIAVDSEIVPHRTEFTTKNHISYLDDAEFETREDSSYAPIKENSRITVSNPSGLNNLNTSLLFGKWLKVKFFFEINTYQALLDIIVKFRISPRIKSK